MRSLLKNRSFLVTLVITLTLFTFSASALASNMGFKLNYGIVNSVNKLLSGSGISIGILTSSNTITRTEPPIEPQKYQDPGDYGGIILNIGQPSPQNSNMGFKLNLQSIPEDGILVEDPYGNLYRLREEVNLEGERYVHLEEVS